MANIANENTKIEWFNNAVIYQIYPIGYCGVSRKNPFSPPTPTGKGEILRIIDHIPEIKRLGFNAVMFNPLFQSTSHGYDTVDFTMLDTRLGTNDDFKTVCKALHENKIKIILDGVFNHVGRDFDRFKDVIKNKQSSVYKDWFHIREGNSPYNDGFYYEGWEGHYELVKLNLYNKAVTDFLKNAISFWITEFDIDGLRLDVAYSLELNFLKELRSHCKGMKSDFWLLGETLHGDYNKWMNSEMLDSVTNYECYKGLYSSFNEMNMFEIAHSLGRQFGGENWCLYNGKRLSCFVDNHDVSRIATALKEPKHIPLIYTLLFTMPGIPSVYYGSEYGLVGDKCSGDDSLRPEFKLDDYDKNHPLALLISKLSAAHSNTPALHSGNYKQLVLTNRQFAFMREDTETNSRAITIINADDSGFNFDIPVKGVFTNITSETKGETIDTNSTITMPAFSSMVLVSGK